MTQPPVESAGRTFRPGIVLALILAAVFSLSAIGVLGAYAPDLQNGDDGRDHALSRSAIGYAGMVKLLRGLDRDVVLSRGTLAGGQDSLLIVTPPTQRDQEALNKLIDTPTLTLVVLPKWDAMQDPGRRGWVRRVGEMAPAGSLSALPEDLADGLAIDIAPGAGMVQLSDEDGYPIGQPVRVEGLRTLSGAKWLPIVTDAAAPASWSSTRRPGSTSWPSRTC